MSKVITPNTTPSQSQSTNWSEGAGQRLYARARVRIPGGTQLFSKRPEAFLPDQWPSYYARAKGCEVWDLDGRRFFDVTYSGIGACLLGFADDDVNEAVKSAVDRGNMTTLNVPEEVELAELLCELHPWARMARYTRSGGEAMAVAMRIARARTRKSCVAFCGYHGWSDWYLAANLASDGNLDGHLMPGLSPRGVPRQLVGTAEAFRFNRLDELRAIVASHGEDLAAVVMEPFRASLPEPGFLEAVREIAHSTNAVFVLDEITSGWRYEVGGAHLMLGVEPDIAVFAKSISNGYAMAAVIGTSDVMQAAQETFISSTFWTEAIGPVAALATIRKLRRLEVPKLLQRVGQRVQNGWGRLAADHQLPDFKITGLPALGKFTFGPASQFQALRTLLTQEMLDRGFLANDYFYATIAHTDAVVDQYLEALNEVFGMLAAAIKLGDVQFRLRGPVAHAGFLRLT